MLLRCHIMSSTGCNPAIKKPCSLVAVHLYSPCLPLFFLQPLTLQSPQDIIMLSVQATVILWSRMQRFIRHVKYRLFPIIHCPISASSFVYHQSKHLDRKRVKGATVFIDGSDDDDNYPNMKHFNFMPPYHNL